MEAESHYTKSEILAELARLGGNWYSPIDLGFGIVTRAGRHQRRFSRRLRLLRIPQDLRGKRVLDIGTWDGFFAFHLESLGAEVFAIDNWRSEEALQHFTFARRVKGSRVSFKRMDVHDLGVEAAGEFDLVFCAGVLYHLRHPFMALERIRKVCRGQLILETVCMVPFMHARFPMIAFWPGDDEAIAKNGGWHIAGAPTIPWVREALLSAGFSRVGVVYRPSFYLWKKLLAGLCNWPRGGRAIFHAWV